MKITETLLPGVLLIAPDVIEDNRGFFQEVYSKQRYRDVGISSIFVQDNHSRSSKGVLRGLHFQLNYPQGKLVRVVSGEVFDVAVDVRVGSPTFGEASWATLSGENHLQFYIPPGFAHGFCVLSEIADFEYKCTDYYHPDDEGGVLWSDSDLNIPWPIEHPKLSAKDRSYSRLRDTPEKLLPHYSFD